MVLCPFCPFSGHFGFIELPIPIYHPSHISELKRMLSLLCLKCLKMKNSKVNESQLHMSPQHLFLLIEKVKRKSFFFCF